MRTQHFRTFSTLVRRAMHLLLAASCCTVFAFLAQSQAQAADFLVPGPSGSHWLDTGIDIDANTLLQLSATGTVNVGGGFGAHGPEGAPAGSMTSPGAGYPFNGADTRYGLIARTIAPPTTMSPGYTEMWAYHEGVVFFSAHGGRLWLTVNDDYADDNTGFFKVHVEHMPFHFEMLCNPCPLDEITVERVIGQPIPDPKAMRVLLAFDGEILSINQSGGTTLISVSQGTALRKYGDWPNLKIIFEKKGTLPGSSASGKSVTQGVIFQNSKMSLIKGASLLKL